MRILGLLALVAVTTCGVLPMASARERIEERSPFEMVRFPDDGAPEVRVRGRWYQFVSIDGVSFERVREGALKVDREDWRRRFSEDLVASLLAVSTKLGRSVVLELRDLENGKVVTLGGVRMSKSNRSRIRDARPWVRPIRLARDHSKTVDERYAFLTMRFHDRTKSPRLSAKLAAEDLDELEWCIEHAFSYRDRVGVDYRAAFDTVRAGLGEGIARSDLRLQLQKLLALFGDGHTGVRGWPRELLQGSLPAIFTSLDEGDSVLALRSGGAPLDSGFPHVVSIDGLHISKWIEAAGRYRPRSTKRAHVMATLERLEDFAHVRAELGLRASENAKLVLSDGSGGTRTVTLSLVRGARGLPRPRRPRSGTFHEGFGYLRIARMQEKETRRALEEIETLFPAPGLIIDVRGNGGGSRELLYRLLPRLMRSDAEPILFNVAAYRMPPGTVARSGGHLGDRGLYTLDSKRFAPRNVTAAKALLASFEPSMAVDPKLFSDWHVAFVYEPSDGRLFRGSIAVLIDEGCFSATDIFVGALELLPNVTLIGTTTGGGSGRSEKLRLANSGIEVRVSTMASFRPNGRSYDGHGIAPDIEVKPTLEDLLGKTDSALVRAVEHLKAQTRK